MQEIYNPKDIEQNVQSCWEEKQLYRVNEDLSKEKFYCLAMFPYPSGYLHVGHVRNYTISDVIARYQRLKGKNVLQPIGWDAFGLPAENAAIKNKVAPAKWTYDNIDHMRKQFKQLGMSFDWSRELATCDPVYYRWEQWLFTRLFEKGLVYKKTAVVNWDPVDKTVLANEQVVDGRGWRSGALVERKEIPQWFIKITAYADELLSGLDTLTGWPEQVKTMQRNWIGRSEGVDVHFPTANNESIDVYTTRPDTLMGVSYLAIAPQHPIALEAAKDNPDLQQFIEECRNIAVSEEALATLEKQGVDTKLTAKHPLTGEDLPIWVANFVVMDYGSGAVMSVPAHDQRDFEFATKYDLNKPVVIHAEDTENYDEKAFTDKGKLINSGEFDGLDFDEASDAIILALEKKELGQRKVNYRLRDWGVSRQRYWGTPIPIIYCNDCGTLPVPENQLPVKLPEDVVPDGTQSPLKSKIGFYQTNCPKCGEVATRETDTFDTFMESSWYYARFASKGQCKSMLDDRAKYWSPVDQYIGGIEHAVMHLLYARFIHKILRDEGLLYCDEPFTKLLTQGMVLKDGAKMSKSKGNTVDPETLIERYGADTLRLFSIFTAPPEQSLEWSDSGVEGSYKFLKRVWAFCHARKDSIQSINAQERNYINWKEQSTELQGFRREMYKLIQQASNDMEKQQLNTVVSAAMKLFNVLGDLAKHVDTLAPSELPLVEQVGYRLINKFVIVLIRILAPITPHICTRLWQDLHYHGTLHDAYWPKLANDALVLDTMDLVIQVNGKVRANFTISKNSDDDTVKSTAMKQDNIVKFTKDKEIKKVIYVPNKLVNIVVGN